MAIEQQNVVTPYVESVDDTHRRFRYLMDPVCLGSMSIYILNRWLLKPNHIGGWIVHDYLNDFLCLPLFVPIILGLQRLLHIRRHDRTPTFLEILHNWVVFTVVFELILPNLKAFDSTTDPWDAVAYLVGGLASFIIWRSKSCCMIMSKYSSHIHKRL